MLQNVAVNAEMSHEENITLIKKLAASSILCVEGIFSLSYLDLR